MSDLLSISDVAQKHFIGLLQQQDEKEVGIRVFVINGGTPQAECGVSFCPISAVEDKDLIQEFAEFKAFVDPDSAPYLEDAEIDYVEEKMGSQLTLRAPNAKARKVAEDAPLIDRVNYIVEAEINPQLASHGGNVRITEITNDDIAILQFGGGCQGCGMADVTLKEGVEKTLMEKFKDELKGVMDITEHAAGTNPYY